MDDYNGWWNTNGYGFGIGDGDAFGYTWGDGKGTGWLYKTEYINPYGNGHNQAIKVYQTFKLRKQNG